MSNDEILSKFGISKRLAYVGLFVEIIFAGLAV